MEVMKEVSTSGTVSGAPPAGFKSASQRSKQSAYNKARTTKSTKSTAKTTKAKVYTAKASDYAAKSKGAPLRFMSTTKGKGATQYTNNSASPRPAGYGAWITNTAYTTWSNAKSAALTAKNSAESEKNTADSEYDSAVSDERTKKAAYDTAREADLLTTKPTQKPPSSTGRGGYGTGKSAGKGKGKGRARSPF